MKFNKSLVLYHFILKKIGFENFEKLKEKCAFDNAGYDTTGHSYYANAMMPIKKEVSNEDILRYDDAIKVYEEELIKKRAEHYLSLKYYQYFALFFTEYFLDRLSNEQDIFLDELNIFKNNGNQYDSIDDYTKDDLKKLAFWMATGSGKTLIMHINYYQVTRYFKDWENIILITPNEGLSRQHYEEFCKSGIKAKLYSGSEESLKTAENEILIIEITKLVKGKEGEGVTVDVDYFSESKNLIFIDEGHKGQRSEEKAWKSIREYLARGGQSFTFEYSATFGQIIGNRNVDLLNEYGKSIIFDYSYRHFYTDGYGKDFSVFNIASTEGYTEQQTKLLLTGSLLGFYEQLVLFEKYEKQLLSFNIEKPLWVFVGSKVIGRKSTSSLTKTDKQSVSDVSLVLNFFKDVLSNPTGLQKNIDKLLSSDSGLNNKDGDDIFKNRFLYLKKNRPDSEKVLQKVFHGVGELEAWKIRQADGEIGIQTSVGKKYFGVINIGDVSSFGKKLAEDFDGELELQDDSFVKSLFRNISEKHSTVNILIGSKKFIEGWNSWRLSSMGLMNMGRNEGVQIIQLFGRGVRLKGKEFSLKREDEHASYFIKTLQTISIFGLNADYMNSFLTSVEKEIEPVREFSLNIRLNQEKKWKNKIITLNTEEGRGFKNIPLKLTVNEKILRRITTDLRPKVALASSGFNSQLAEQQEEYHALNPVHEYIDFIDFGVLTLSVNRFKFIKNYRNLVIEKQILKEILENPSYTIQVLHGQFTLKDALKGRIQTIAEAVIKDYITKFYTDKEKNYLTKNLTFDFLSKEKYPEIFPENEKIIVKVPEDKISMLENVFKDIEKFYSEPVVEEIPTIHFDKHLYSPIASYKKGKEDIITIPVKINEGETRFIEHLRAYLISISLRSSRLDGKEVYILRNLSKRGLGFFVESTGFYPDFIIWILEGKRQTILFVDPKGILMLGNFNHDKIVFCNKTIKEISKKVQQKIKEKSKDIDVELKAYILSVTDYNDIRNSWGDGKVPTPKNDFEENKVLFIEESKTYLDTMFDGII